MKTYNLGSDEQKTTKSQEDLELKVKNKLGIGEEWSFVSNKIRDDFDDGLEFIGQNFENGKFSGENLEGANFSVANLQGVDFSGANLKNVDFSGSNLSGANMSGADLSGAILTGAMLRGTDFSKAKLNGVKLVDADIEDVILLDIEIDAIALGDLQSLIEYLAKYYPHKLNLSKINLTLLDLSRIDLSRVSLRGVDFTGVDFTGVNITGLDLSECNITPEQIAQALGRVPGAEELKRIMAPKKKEKVNFNGVDFSELFLGNGREFGVWDFTHDKGISVESLLKTGKKVFTKVHQPKVKDEQALADVKTEQEIQAKNHNRELKEKIEARKKAEYEKRVELKKQAEEKKRESYGNIPHVKENVRDNR